MCIRDRSGLEALGEGKLEGLEKLGGDLGEKLGGGLGGLFGNKSEEKKP